MPDSPTALDGLRVVELGDFISVAYAGKLLADLGADVIKVEPPGGDSARAHGPFPHDTPHPERSGLFLFLNTNKRSVTIDLDAAAAQQALRQLLGDADLLLHNLAPPRARELGLTYDDLRLENPDIIVSAITPFGVGTPREDWAATALTVTAASGLAHYIGDPDRAPLWLPYCAADFQAGIHAAASALLALRARERTGAGQETWVAAVEVLTNLLGAGMVSQYVYRGQLRQRAGVRMNAFYPWQVAPAADGYFEVITMVDAQWDRFVELMGRPAWAADERLRNRWLAFQWAEELDAHWHPWLRARTKAELWALFRERAIPFQPVQTVDEVLSSSQLRQREFWAGVDTPEAGRMTMPGAPYRLSATPWRVRRSAPRLGEHNGEAFPARPRSRRVAGADAGRVRPLDGIRVLDHGHVWAGPVLGLMLADMGAEVIKLQSPGRRSGVDMGGVSAAVALGGADNPPADDPLAYHGYDRGKRSITLDLSAEAGRDLYLRLVSVSDVVIENFAPRVMPGLGLGYEALRAVNPRIIMASLSAAGATPGPWRDLVTYGPSLGALYGLKSVQGYADDPWPREDRADLDPTAAGHAFVAILAALAYRDRSGEGQFLDIAQGECALQRLAEPLLDLVLNGRVAGPQGNRYPGRAPHGIYRAAGDDRWLAIAARDETDWAALRSVVGAALADPRFDTLAGRLEHQDALDTALESWTAPRDAWAASEALQAAGVPAHPVLSPPDIVADSNHDMLRQTGFVMDTPGGVGADRLYQGIVWKLSATPGAVLEPTRPRGHDNAAVFGGLLGLGEAELASLRESGVI